MPGWAWARALRLARFASLRFPLARVRGSAAPADADRPRAARAHVARRDEATADPRRHDELELRPLTMAAMVRYREEWQDVQARFVDDPSGAVRTADGLIQSVMRERGYPVDDFEQRAADVSVDHPNVVENYREGHRLAGSSDTEEQRQAMVHYRALFDELLEDTADAPLARDSRAGDRSGVH
jgi:hypothetical protein